MSVLLALLLLKGHTLSTLLFALTALVKFLCLSGLESAVFF